MGSLNLNWKLVSAFVTGAVLASGIVYFAVRPVDVAKLDVAKLDVAKLDVAKLDVPKLDAPKPLATASPATRIAAASPAPLPAAHAPARLRVPVRDKPSPMPPPLRYQRESVVDHVLAHVVVHNDAPPQPPAIEPVPQKTEVTPPPAAAEPPPPENVPVQNVSSPAPAEPVRVPHTVTLVAGTLLPVRVGETLSSAHHQPGDTFLATLTQPLVIDGFVIAERGARVEGKVLDTTAAGRVKGVSHLGISIVRLATADGQNIRIRTEPFVKDGPTSTGTDAAKIGGGAAIGAIVGALAGGGRGASIGAGAGGAVGAGDVLLARGKPTEIPVETRVSFKVQDSVTITERLD
jgi:hypothetical protein